MPKIVFFFFFVSCMQFTFAYLAFACFRAFLSLVFSSQGGDRAIRVWSAADGACLKTLEGHASAVLTCAFVTHGMQLLSGSADGALKLWTLKTGECAATFERHDDKVWSLSVGSSSSSTSASASGAGAAGPAGAGAAFCVTGGADSVVNVWRDVTVAEADAEQAAAAQRVLKEQALSNCVQLKQWCVRRSVCVCDPDHCVVH